MNLRSKPQIVIIDDDIPAVDYNYPLVDMLKIEYGGEDVHLFQDPNQGIEFIEQNLSKKIIVLLDIIFNGKSEGFNVFDAIVKKSSLVCFILMTGNLEKIDRRELVKFINGHGWYYVQRDRPAGEIMSIVKNAEHYLVTRIDGALEEWILKHSPENQMKPYLKTSDGKMYTLLEILQSIREGSNNAFGQEMVAGILNLTIDLLARNKEQL